MPGRPPSPVLEAALAILREARSTPPPDLHAVRLALYVLKPLCAETWPLDSFWRDAGERDSADGGIGRRAGLTAAFNGILHQLGRKPE